jgi:hypothetical protein
MKVLNRFLIILFNICLLAVTLAAPALSMMASRTYYHEQFEKTGIYAQVDEDGNETRTVIRFIGGESGQNATFSDEQLDVIADHIITYLFSDKESFQLVMDDVMLNGVETDGVAIFGPVAVTHMEDVRNLVRFCKTAAIIAGVMMVAIGVYLVWKLKKTGRMILKTSLIFFAVVIGLIVLFCGWAAVATMLSGGFTMDGFLSTLWTNVHYLLFPFQGDKFANSFMNDPLTEILTLDLFMTAVYRIVIILAAVIVLWLLLGAVANAKAKQWQRMQQRKLQALQAQKQTKKQKRVAGIKRKRK